MTDPITPPLALIDQWWEEAKQNAKYDEPIGPLVATQAARWGADQELEACAAWVRERKFDGDGEVWSWATSLRAARRLKPPSLKEQALALINKGTDLEGIYLNVEAHKFIRRALEALDDN